MVSDSDTEKQTIVSKTILTGNLVLGEVLWGSLEN